MTFGRPGPGLQIWVLSAILALYFHYYPDQKGNVDNGRYCLYFKQHETMKVKSLISYFADPQLFGK